MTFWQENYGFVKEVYEYRMTKYKEWMDNLEAIVTKVLAQNVQYTYKEFKIIQDTLASLCRDLEKEGMKEWLDMMLEKVSMRVSDEGGSARDKEFKKTEKKRLQALIDRHDKLMPKTLESQEKVEVYAKCYAYGDDLSPMLKSLEEMHHLSTKEIHPFSLNMVEEQVEKIQKVISTIEGFSESYDDFIRKGQMLLKDPLCAPFLAPLVEKLQHIWKESNDKSKDRLTLLQTAVRDWEKYDDMRTHIIEPCDRLETDFKTYSKYYDPKMGAERIKQKRMIWEECKAKANDMFKNMQKCYTTIALLAGEDKREFLDKEVSDIDDKRNIIMKCEQKLKELEEYNEKLTKAVVESYDLKEWSLKTEQRLNELKNAKGTGKTQEERVKENICLQEECRKKLQQVAKLEYEFRKLLTVDDVTRSPVARKTMDEFEEMKRFLKETCSNIEKENGEISAFFGKVTQLCKAWDDMETVTDALLNALNNLSPVVNPGVASLEGMFKRINDIKGRKAKIMESM